MPTASSSVERLTQGPHAGVVDVSHPERVEHERVRPAGGAVADRGPHLGTEVDRVSVPERCREQHDQDAGNLSGARGPAHGAQLVVCGTRPST